jgi:hypothetical protein
MLHVSMPSKFALGVMMGGPCDALKQEAQPCSVRDSPVVQPLFGRTFLADNPLVTLVVPSLIHLLLVV